ncbi:hypothetical protein Tco_0928621 [Tanacetum coccineum]
MEGLHIAFKDAVSSGLISGAKIGDLGFKLSRLFYADDVMIISDWNMQDMINIIRVQHVFFLASGLKINVSNSNIYELGVSSHDIENLARDTGCDSGWDEYWKFESFNLALLQKWRWKLVNNPDSLWARVIIAIRGVEAGLDLKGYANEGCLLSDRSVNASWVWNWKRQVVGSQNEVALNILVLNLGKVQLCDRPDSWSWSLDEYGIFFLFMSQEIILTLA